MVASSKCAANIRTAALNLSSACTVRMLAVAQLPSHPIKFLHWGHGQIESGFKYT